MGGRWETKQWVWLGGAYGYESLYMGQSLVRALIAAVRAKRAGAGAVTVVWR